jgi:hypothetical protein
LITRTIFCEEYGSLSSSLCSFLHSAVTSFLLGPNILLGACLYFVTMPLFKARSCQHLAQPSCWRTTPCRPSAAV